MDGIDVTLVVTLWDKENSSVWLRSIYWLVGVWGCICSTYGWLSDSSSWVRLLLKV